MDRITYTNEIVGAHSNQINGEAGIYVDGEIIGVAQYVLYDGELTISDIFVRPEFRRNGYGSRLIKYIKKENTRYEYAPSMKTEDGGKFIHKDLPLEEEMKAKFIYESLEFERGRDPKSAMDIGINPFTIKDFKNEMAAADWIVKYWNVIYPELHIDYSKPVYSRITFPIQRSIIEYIENYITIEGRRLYPGFMMGIEKKVYDGLNKDLNENISFQKGLEPKEALGIGRTIWVRGDRGSGLYKARLINPYEGPDKMEDEEIWEIEILDGDSKGNKPYAVKDARYRDINYDEESEHKIWGEIDPFVGWGSGMNESLDFERGLDPKKTMEIGRLPELKANWDRMYPNQGVSPEDAMDQLIDQSLRDNIIWKLDSHQPEWTVMYQINVLNYIILNGGEAPYSDIKPERGIPEQTMRRVFRALVENGTLVKGKIGRSVWYYLAKGKYAYRDSFNESLDFERGRDPKGSMDIGMKSKMIEKYLDLAEDNIASGSKWRKLIWDNFAPELIAAIPDRFKNDKGEPKTFGWGNFDMPLKKNVFTPEELGIFYNIINKYWNKVFGANESVNFERGIDPKEKMNIGMRHDAIEIITIAAEETGADFEGDQIHEILSDVVENPETQDEWAVEYYVDKAIPITDWRNLHSFSGRYVMYDGSYYLIPYINYNE